MAVGSAQRRQERKPRIEGQFSSADVEAALDLLHLVDMAWHDCFGPRELEMPAQVLDDVLLLAGGTSQTDPDLSIGCSGLPGHPNGCGPRACEEPVVHAYIRRRQPSHPLIGKRVRLCHRRTCSRGRVLAVLL
jgi:hypothetical protein